ncbi:glycosyltransferase [Microbacterium yannicii]|uniref:glycosyltransferase n=1 Tax=Microbacterium yannicii TaxID=671622 RepID=UPI0002D3123A|nr:glycosyltransferase [Microbacterium yannicii]
MSSAPPSVAVVLPSFHRLERLPPLVSEYRRQGADQIIVVLDGPHPGWRDILPPPDDRLSVIELPANVGLALARIEGLRHARGDVVLAVDDDVIPGENLVATHRSFHADGGDRVLQGYMPVALPRRRSRDDAPSYIYARDYEAQVRVWRRSGSETILRSLWGGNVSMPRDLYERAEAAKPSQRLDYNEDLDLGIRLLALGATAEFDDAARAAHHHSRGLRAYMRECEVRGHAVWDLEQRWGERPTQLGSLVEIPPPYNRVLAAGQRSIAARDRGGVVQAFAVATYRAAGLLRVWTLQDGVTRFLRRALALRGYRRARTTTRMRDVRDRSEISV